MFAETLKRNMYSDRTNRLQAENYGKVNPQVVYRFNDDIIAKANI